MLKQNPFEENPFVVYCRRGNKHIFKYDFTFMEKIEQVKRIDIKKLAGEGSGDFFFTSKSQMMIARLREILLYDFEQQQELRQIRLLNTNESLDKIIVPKGYDYQTKSQIICRRQD